MRLTNKYFSFFGPHKVSKASLLPILIVRQGVRFSKETTWQGYRRLKNGKVGLGCVSVTVVDEKLRPGRRLNAIKGKHLIE